IADWHHDAGIKVPRGQDIELVMAEGALLFDQASKSIIRSTRVRLPAREPEITRMLAAYPLRKLVTRSRRLPLFVERERALYGSWYEFFPRSEGVQIDPMGRREPVSGTLQTAIPRLDAIREMGFDLVYLPPIHPIGSAYRKGRNNTLDPQPGDPGSPWAI